jgi:DNA-damage-inducible protein J
VEAESHGGGAAAEPGRYQQVRLNRGLPFDVRIPNAVTRRTFAETDAGENIVPCENAQEMFARLGI